jgi:hypothetical protein
MKRFITPSWWATHWPNAAVYVAVCAVFVFTVNRTDDLRADDRRAAFDRAAALRNAQVEFCDEGNKRTDVLRDFALSLAQPPDPRQFEFIADPELRRGVFEQATRSRAEMRGRIDETFKPRDCERAFPLVATPAEK